jgi:serine/threonine protein kinase
VLFRSTLKNILSYSEHKKPPVHAARIIAKKCLESLEFYHAKGMMHHDVKPENFLVYLHENELPSNLEIELIDFSLSTFMKSSKNQNVITLWWRPLELFLKSCNHSNTVDVWSLGLVILELLTGRNLFRGTKTPTRIVEIIFYYWGYPCKADWPELHSCFKLNEEGKIPTDNLLYGLYNDEFITYKSFLPIFSLFFKLNGKDRISCQDLLKHEFFAHVPFEKEIQESNAWFVSAINFANQEKFKYFPSNVVDPLPKSYGIYSWSKSMELLTPIKSIKKSKSLKRQRVDESNDFLPNLERIISSKDFIVSLCTTFTIPKTELIEENFNYQSTRILLASLLFYCSNVNEVHMGCIIVVCSYISFCLSMDNAPSIFEMIEIINVEKESFYKECTKIFPKILKVLNCELPDLNNVVFKKFIFDELWILG